ncbi:MAG TPA: phosphoribosylanthranilate isomerase, partial [Sporomusaceae bacterium]|nr:phosphoribosylanthranilate isomerase [Sporomusaceae bacterium]
MAEAAQAAGADWIGFVFANSRRRIDSAAAREISRKVPDIGKVGVFVNAPLAEVQEIAMQCKLDYIQLHGEESADYCCALQLPVIKAIKPG